MRCYSLDIFVIQQGKVQFFFNKKGQGKAKGSAFDSTKVKQYTFVGPRCMDEEETFPQCSALNKIGQIWQFCARAQEI